MKGRTEGFRPRAYVLFGVLTLLTLVLCTGAGSVGVPFSESVRAVFDALRGAAADGTADRIIIPVRLPRVLCAALEGAALALCGGAMQGLLRNPLADGSTLGVSSGAALGAALSIAFGVSLGGLGTMGMAMLFSFLSLLLILALSYKLDYSLSTNTIILIGVIFTMFVSSLLSLAITFAGSKLRTLTFWTMGSLSGRSYGDALALLLALLVFGTPLLLKSRELNAFAVSEDNARGVGIDVRRTKLLVLVCVAALIGVCVSIAGSIGFVGLVVPHMLRLLTGPSHRRLLPACLFGGACLLMLCDLLARTVAAPLVLPIGVITSLIGAVVFVLIFARARKGG